jgi:hypothetical protein
MDDAPLSLHHLDRLMRRLGYSLLVSCFGFAGTALAQGPARPMAMMNGGPPPGVEMLLSQTGALQLTDAQVVRLAAIARRAEDRHRALRTRLDSLRPRRAPAARDSSSRRERPMPPTDLFERERDASHADLRDALAVLTADQQARAWEMIAARRAMPFRRAGARMRDDGARGRTPQRDGRGD